MLAPLSSGLAGRQQSGDRLRDSCQNHVNMHIVNRSWSAEWPFVLFREEEHTRGVCEIDQLELEGWFRQWGNRASSIHGLTSKRYSHGLAWRATCGRHMHSHQVIGYYCRKTTLVPARKSVVRCGNVTGAPAPTFASLSLHMCVEKRSHGSP